MPTPAITQVERPAPVALSRRWKTAFVVFVALGALVFAGGLALDPVRAWHDYLVGYFLFVGFSLFGLFFTALHHAVNAKWWIVTRRVAEGLTAALPVALVLFVILILGLRCLYPWATGEEFHQTSKQAYLSPLWFSVRGIVFLVIWILFARRLVSLSLKQDRTGEPRLSRTMLVWSVVFLPIFAGTFSLTCFDLLMSLQPHWYSTLFGVYGFAGFFQSGLALLTILFILMKRQGALAEVATPSHLKDLGTLVFAFTIFMTYIGFSQFMLIWYANLPEETTFFIRRSQGGWELLFLALPVLKFAVPFFGLLSQALKMKEKWLLTVCTVVLVGQYCDVYWLVMPTASEVIVPIGWMEVGTLLGFVGLFGLATARFYSRHAALAYRDPRILQSVNWRFWE